MANEPQPKPPANTDAAALVQQMLSQIQTAPSSLKKEPEVYYGEARESTGMGKTEASVLGRKPLQGINTKTLDQANLDFYGMSPAELAAFQDRLLSSGLVKASDIYYGDYDDTSYKVWQMMNERSSRFLAAGQHITPSDVLEMMARSRPGDGMGGGAQGNVDLRTDPVTLEQQIQQVAASKLGRKMSKRDVEKFTAIYAGIEGSKFAAAKAAAPTVAAGGDVQITEAVSSGVAAEQFVESNYATEAAAYDTTDYFAALESMLGGN